KPVVYCTFAVLPTTPAAGAPSETAVRVSFAVQAYFCQLDGENADVFKTAKYFGPDSRRLDGTSGCAVICGGAKSACGAAKRNSLDESTRHQRTKSLLRPRWEGTSTKGSADFCERGYWRDQPEV